MHHLNRFHLSTFVFPSIFGRSGFWPLFAHPSMPSLIYYRPRCPLPLSPSLRCLHSLAPTHRSGTHSPDARTCALHRHYSNCQWSSTTTQPTDQTTPRSSSFLPPGVLSFFMCFFPANKAWKVNRCLIFMLYMIKVANSFNLWGFTFFPSFGVSNCR